MPSNRRCHANLTAVGSRFRTLAQYPVDLERGSTVRAPWPPLTDTHKRMADFHARLPAAETCISLGRRSLGRSNGQMDGQWIGQRSLSPRWVLEGPSSRIL